jgi:hypothetical protein
MTIHCCPVLSAKEKEIISHICSLSTKYDKSGGCTLSNNQLAFRHQSTNISVSQAISKAKRLGWQVSREDDTIQVPMKSIDGVAYRNIRRLCIHPSEEWTVFAELFDAVYFGGETEGLPIIERLGKEMTDDKNGENWQRIAVSIALEAVENGWGDLDQNQLERLRGGVLKNNNTPPCENPPLNSNRIILSKANIIKGGSQEEPRSSSFENRRIKRNKEATHQNETTSSRYNNTTPKTRKRTIEVPPTPPAAVSVKTDDFVEYWNGLKGAAPHRNPATQVYKDCAAAIRKLAAGTLFKNKAVDPVWMKKRRIPPKYLSRQLSPAQVRGVLDSLALLYLEGYWPQDKEWVKGLGLKNLLYNKNKLNSQALAVMVSPPQPLKEQLDKWAEDKEDDATKADIEVILAAVEESGLPTPSRRDAAQVIDIVWAWWDTWDEEARDRVPGHTNILNWFGDWLKIKARKWPTMPIRVVKKDSDTMQEFVDWVERDCLGGVDVETNGLR